LNSLDEQESIFGKLSDGGAVTMPLQDTFWGARFGMLTDKFGINWMLNCEVHPHIPA
jgi:PhnB protein